MPKLRHSSSDSSGNEADLAKRVRKLEQTLHDVRAKQDIVDDLRGSLGALPEKILMVNRISQEINSLDLDRISKIATHDLPALVGARYCSLFLYDYANNELTLQAHNHPEELPARISLRHHEHTVMGMALRAKKMIHISDFAAWERESGRPLERTFADKYATQGCISIPLRTGNYIVGILNFADRADGVTFDAARDLPLMDQLAQMLAMAIRNCILVRELQSQARTDALTRLANYRAFHEALRAEIHRAGRYGRPLSLLMMDVDGFKQVNDDAGHQAGDFVLAELARILRNLLRREDLPARYGGDEIAVILPETGAEGGRALSQRIVTAVREHEYTFGGRALRVSVSIGAAVFRPELSITQFVGAADEALYRAKQAGKDRVVFAGEKIPAG